MVLPVFTFAAVPVYATIAQDSVIFEAMSYYGAADAPIVVEESDIDDDRADPVVVTSLVLMSVPNRSTYDYGDSIDFTGLQVLARYSNDSEVIITSLQHFALLSVSSTVANATSPYMMVAPQIVELSIDSQTVSFIIDVYKVINTLTLITKPTKLEYNWNEHINLDGVMLVAKYTDNFTETITYDNIGLTIDNSDIANKTESDKDVAVQTVALAYKGKTVTFEITVFNPITGIEIFEQGSDLNYTYKFGESIQYHKLMIEVTRLDGTTRTLYAAKLVEDAEVITEGFTFNTKKAEYTVNEDRTNLWSDTVTVEVYYGAEETSFDITVENDVKEINIAQYPEKLDYVYGDALELYDMKVNATHLDGTVEEDVNYTCAVTALTEPGVQTIPVTYEGKETSFTVIVHNPLIDLWLLRGPYKTLYRTGQSFSPEGIELRAFYKDGTNEFIASGYSVYGFSSSSQVIGQILTVTYSYDGGTKSVTFPVDIFAPSALSTGGAYSLFYKDNVEFEPSVPSRSYQSGVSYDYWISDTSVADIDAGRIYGLRRGTVNLRVTAVETIEKDGQTLVFEYAERTTIRVKLTFWQWFVKFFILFGWLGFDIYI